MYSPTGVTDSQSTPADRAVAPAEGWRELFWVAFEQSATAMSVTRDDRVVVAVNHELGGLTRFEPDELVGRPLDKLVPLNWRKVQLRDEEALRDAGTLDARREVRRRDGHRLRVRLVARRVVLVGNWLTLWTAQEDGRPIVPTQTEEFTPRGLSARELEVVSGLAQGMRVREIASSLGISSTTVTTHVRNATRKLEARSRTHLVAMVLARELIDPNLVLTDGRLS